MVKITIDTDSDSKLVIKKTIRFLRDLISDNDYSSNNSSKNVFDNSDSLPSPGAFNIFGDNDNNSNGSSKHDDSDDEPPARIEIVDY